MGHRVFDDGCRILERTLTQVGDGSALNAGSILQAHSLEEGVFKSDRVTIGNGCTIGTSAFVHYGVVIDDHARIDADSFLMGRTRTGTRPVGRQSGSGTDHRCLLPRKAVVECARAFRLAYLP
ncbi:hypothetical protein JBE04_29170 [Streptomyces sp. PRKS01-29]|nr:hypothetical protein [Streptomyces sabulosicollis]MBI0298424.1 hypothetical protein [Streptomyces sabulosicollis]